ncbi:MAG TPA: cellobiose phosphorylase, partial [Candidatus Omnitrophota bacterium]|nr:cellobiose phosphorylase [Candidatus Omnitrophota bacterium]
MNKLWRFTDKFGSFESKDAEKIRTLYFPLCNERLMSSVSPDLHGDIKAAQDAFLLTPVSRQDLIDSRASRNFWIKIGDCPRRGLSPIFWSATGVSKNLKQIEEDKFHLEAGLLWHKISRENKNIGLKAEVLSFVPASNEPIEIMQVTLTNVSSRKINFVPTAAIPIYGRAANNLRDHRQVTSLLQRITLHKFGLIVKPTLVFDESGHKPNKTIYFVLGCDQNTNPPEYLYPTQEMFCGEGGDLEAPEVILKNLLPDKRHIQGKEAMGALRFKSITLRPQEEHSYIILMGIVKDKRQIERIINKFNSLNKIKRSLDQTKRFWINKSRQFSLSTGKPDTFAPPSAGLSINPRESRRVDFANWFRWVSIQPALRRIFGCSFLPDFD